VTSLISEKSAEAWRPFLTRRLKPQGSSEREDEVDEAVSYAGLRGFSPLLLKGLEGRSRGIGDRMIWVILATLGVPLWLCALGIFMILFNNRTLRHRDGDMTVRVRRPGKKRWIRGHGIWVSDVFAWRGSPAGWREDLNRVVGVTVRAPDAAEQKKLHRLGDGFLIATLLVGEGDTLEVATGRQRRSALVGPFEPLSDVTPEMGRFA
jgi:hypothetical protein